ncbi:MAG: hypothetical protein D6748_03375 [Calditrichaeota bacterium]|nr:MAG: hypothetical protein D6748_03375 [Calditrichota bacterium]
MNDKWWFYQLPAVLWALLIFIASSLPDIPGPRLNIQFEDKLDHLVVYAVFGFLLCRAFLYQNRFPGWRESYILLSIVVGILYGLSDEFHQYFVPGRYSEWMDVLADSIGIILGVSAFKVYISLRANFTD